MRVWLWVAVLAVFIMASSHLDPSIVGPFRTSGFFNVDTIIHLVMFCWFGFLIARLLSSSLRIESVELVLLAGSISAAFGILHESYQLYVCRERAEFHDVVIDLIGGTAGGLIAWVEALLRSLVRRVPDQRARTVGLRIAHAFTACSLGLMTILPALWLISGLSPRVVALLKSDRFHETGVTLISPIRGLLQVSRVSNPEKSTDLQAFEEYDPRDVGVNLAPAEHGAPEPSRPANTSGNLFDEVNSFVEEIIKDTEMQKSQSPGGNAGSAQPDSTGTSDKPFVQRVKRLYDQGPVAVIVHPDNPLTELTINDVGKLFGGDCANWRVLGGSDLPVSVVEQAPPGRRDEKLVQSFLGAHCASHSLALPFASLVFAWVAQTPGAVGLVPTRSLFQRNWIERNRAVRRIHIPASTRHPDIYF